MDTRSKPPPLASVPLSFTLEEIESFFDPKKGRKFHEERFRKLLAEKLLVITLRLWYGQLVDQPGDVHKYLVFKRLTLSKGRRRPWGFQLFTVSYEYQGEYQKRTFRFVRDAAQDSLHGNLYPQQDFRPAK